jgi:hypothetical protein
MLTQGLDQETEKFLAEILAQEKTTTDELIKNLIRDRWLSLYRPTTLDRELDQSDQSDQLDQADSAEQHLSGEASLEVHEFTQPESSSLESQSHSVDEQLFNGFSTGTKQKNNKQTIAAFIKKKRFC